MSKIIKVVLAVLFFICLFNMPYGYFQLVRALAMVGFSILAYQSYNSKRIIEMIIYIGLLILFQPLFKIALGREVWNILDIVVGFGLVVSIFTPLNSKDNK